MSYLNQVEQMCSKKERKKMNLKNLLKRLNVDSSWPMQPVLLQFAAQIRVAEKQGASDHDVKKAVLKQTERFLRMGARFAYEFNVNPVKLLDMAQQQIEREIPGAKKRIEEAKAKEFADKLMAAEAIKAQILAFGMDKN